MKKQKKGFTITELVIVIAVIAVLAAVLIPTFVSLVRRANESKDIQLVHNLNTALTIDGEKHYTMQDALDAALESGYDVDKINAAATGNEILWDGTNDQFCYLKDGEVQYIPDSKREETDTAKITYWQICDSMPDTQTYAIYAGENWPDADAEIPNLTVGFDAGKNTNITSVTYTGASKTAVIRTNGGTLTVEAPNDTVHHYGKADSVNITAIASESYHEHGIVGDKITLNNGRVVMEKGGSASEIDIAATAENITNGSAVINVDNTASPETVIMVKEAVKTAIETKGGKNKITAAEGSLLVYGENTKASVGTKTFDTFDSEDIVNPGALQYWKAKGGTLRLISDNTLTEGMTLKKECTLDLNGHKLTMSQQLQAGKSTGTSDADLTIKNGELVVQGGVGIYSLGNAKVTLENVTMTVENASAFVVCLGSNNNTVVLKNSKINGGKYGVSEFGENNNVTIEDCEILNTGDFGVYHNGSTSPSTYTIKNTTISNKNGAGIYISGSVNNNARQTLVMENCTVTGPTAVEIKHTDATITGCTLIASTTNQTAKESGGGSCTTGYAFAATGNGASDNVTGTITLADCKLCVQTAENESGKAFVFQTAEGASVTINGKVVTTFDTYYTSAA